VPLGFAKLRLPDLAGLAPRQPDPQAPVHLACGQGPDLTLDGKQLPTSVSGSVGDLLSLRPLALRTCAMPTLEPGSHHLVAGSSAALSVDALTLAPSDAPISVALSSRPFNTRYWSDESRSILAGPGPATYLALTDNFNLGWHATLAGKSVRAIRVDGWRQAFIIPAGPGGVVTIRFTPGETYRWAQLIGLAAVLVLLVLFVGPQLNVEAAAGPRSVPPWVVVALGAALLIWTGGALVLLLPLLLLVPARHRQMPVIAALAYACAGLFVAYQAGQFPGSGAGAFGAPAQLLAVVALAALTVSLVETAGRGRADISVVMPLNG
jgi:arabinofuranan 3-O-arabinosyltransferase